MGRILDVMLESVSARNLEYTQEYDKDGKTRLVLPIQGKNGRWILMAESLEDSDLCLIYSQCMKLAPEGTRMTVAEHVTRLNSGLLMGNFELDFDDGDIRFKTNVDVGETVFAREHFELLACNNVSYFDAYLPNLMRVIGGEITPVEATMEDNDITVYFADMDEDDGWNILQY